MTTHLIEALLPGPVDAEIELWLASELPLTLRAIDRQNPYAPDHRIDSRTAEKLGSGWSMTSPKSGIPYVGIIVEHPDGRRIEGVAWQSGGHQGPWFAQLQSISAVKFNA